MKFKPLGARALVKEVEREQTTESGIVLPDTAKEKPQNAEVVAVGAHEDAKVSAGDVVVVRKYSGTEVELDGAEHRIVDAEDILGVVGRGVRQPTEGQGLTAPLRRGRFSWEAPELSRPLPFLPRLRCTGYRVWRKVTVIALTAEASERIEDVLFLCSEP